VVITDNLKRRIVKQFRIADDLTVLFLIPAEKTYTISSDVQRMKAVATLIKAPYKEALKGNYWSALTINGLIYSSTLGYNPSIALDAILAGAVASGLSGKGPAVTAVVPNDKIDSVKNAWQAYEGEVLEARINHEKAKVIG
jgi:shikimate kinase